MLTHLRLQGFKSWKDTGDIALRPITGIFGANSSGKTSLIQALLLLKQTAESSDRNLTLHFGDRNTPTDLGDFSSAVHRHDPAGAIEVSLGWKQERPLTIKDTKEKNRVVTTSDEVAFARGSMCASNRRGRATIPRSSLRRCRTASATPSFGIRRAPGKDRFELFADTPAFDFAKAAGRPWSSLEPVKYYGFPDAARASFQNAGFVADLAFALEQQLQSVYYLGPLRAQPERLYGWSGERPTDMGRAGESGRRGDVELGAERRENQSWPGEETPLARAACRVLAQGARPDPRLSRGSPHGEQSALPGQGAEVRRGPGVSHHRRGLRRLADPARSGPLFLCAEGLDDHPRAARDSLAPGQFKPDSQMF